MTSTVCIQAADFQTNITNVNDTCNQTFTFPTSVGVEITALTYISFAVICTFLLLGMLGNLLTITVTVKFNEALKSHDILIIALALCDITMVTTTPFNHPDVLDVLGMDIRAVTTLVCKLYMGLGQSLRFSSVAIKVIVSIERFVAVWFPLRARFLLTRQRILRSVCVSVSTCFLIYVTMCILYTEIQNGLCNANFSGSSYSTILHQMPDTTAYNALIAMMHIISVLILSSLTPLTIHKLVKQGAIRRQLTGQNNEIVGQSVRITMKLVSVVIAYVALVGLPSIVLGAAAQMSINIYSVRGLHSAIIYSFVIDQSTNFLIYNAFDREFRKKVVDLFGLYAQEKPPNVENELQEIKNE